MSRQRFDAQCPGCAPVLFDLQTGAAVAYTDPAMVALHAVWATVDDPDRAAFHRVTCQNSRDAGDLAIVKRLAERLRGALAEQRTQ
jgi:hypothetical protein